MSTSRSFFRGGLNILLILSISGLLLSVQTGTIQAASAISAENLRPRCLNAEGVRSAKKPETGQLRFVGTAPGRPIRQLVTLSDSASPEDAARAYLAQCGSLFGVRNQAAELAVKREKTLETGQSMVHFQQVHSGIPVIGGELIVNLDSEKNILAINGEILPDLSLDTNPGIAVDTAQQIALESVAKDYQFDPATLTATLPELWIYVPMLISPTNGPSRLVWRMDVTALELSPINELVLVDAQRGSVELSFNQIDTARNRETYTANNGTTLPGTLVCNESNPSCSGGDSHAAAAHTYAGDTYDFYWAYHGRDSINNAGMTIRSTVHYRSGYANAFWNGSQMVYGDAYGFALADDVVGHELTHGVTQYESNLFYYYQSGAINESFSDLWGEFVDLTNGKGNDDPSVRWLLGEDISGLGATRNMQNPPAFSHPDKMTSSYYYTGASDGGGVHTNSGVNNKAVYLMTDGGSFNGYTITGLGITKVAKIYYEAQANLLTSGADYADLYESLYQACLNLVGTSGITSSDCNQVRNATLAVQMNQQPVAGYNPDAPTCTGGQSPVNLFFDNLEGGTGNWTFGALTGTNRWRYDSPYGAFAHSGSHFLFADDYPATITDTYAAMNLSVALPANAYLHFYHAYGFEGSAWDGGVLEYSTNGGGSWTDAGSLFDYNGYKGTISSSFGNPLGGRSAFVADSHGYYSSRLNLSSLAGQSVRFRWRMGLDSSGYDWGWWLDDVRIYTCTTGGTPPGAFNKSSPPNGATSQPTSLTLSWGSSSGATSYEYCYDTSNDNACSGWTSSGAATSVGLSGLNYSTTYYWQVRAVNTYGTTYANGSSTAYWWFTTQAPAIRDDTDYSIQYDGWTGALDVLASGGGYRSASLAGQSLVYKTTASTKSFNLLTYIGPDQGKAQVLVDGVVKKSLDLYAAAPAYTSVAVTGLPLTKHTITVKVLGQKNTLSTGTNVRVDGFVVGAATIDDDEVAVKYSKWSAKANASAYGGSYRYSASSGAKVTIRFTGTSFTWVTARGSSYGKADIYVDGAYVQTVDLYNASAVWQYKVVISGLSSGSHTVEIRVLGTKNSRSTGKTVIFDGFMSE